MPSNRRGRTYNPRTELKKQNIEDKQFQQKEDVDLTFTSSNQIEFSEVTKDENSQIRSFININRNIEKIESILNENFSNQIDDSKLDDNLFDEDEIDELSKQIQKDIQEELSEKQSEDEEVLPEIVIPKSINIENFYKKKDEVTNVENVNDSPHYVFKRNTNNGKVEIITNSSEVINNMNDSKKELAKSMLDSIDKEIMKSELEIEIHSEIFNRIIDPIEISENQRKIDIFNKNLIYLKNRKEALLKILGNSN